MANLMMHIQPNSSRNPNKKLVMLLRAVAVINTGLIFYAFANNLEPVKAPTTNPM